MQLSKRALFSAVVVAAYSLCPLFAEDLAEKDQADQDFKAIQEYIEAKRNISVKDKGGSLRIGGDVKVQYKRVHQVADGQKVEGNGTGGGRKASDLDIPQNRADVEATLSFEYTHDTSYADVVFKFQNHMGLDNTNYNDLDKPTGDYNNLNYKSAYQPGNSKIAMARAVIGSELWTQDSHKVVGEIGRQRLYDLFDSRVMFFNRFDGIALKYTGQFEGIGNAHFTYGGFLISDRVSHYGNAFEMGLSQVLDTPLNVKYAFIDWEKKGIYADGTDHRKNDDDAQNSATGTNAKNCGLFRTFRYQVSQLSASYYLPSEWFGGRAMKVYAAYLYNHAARTMTDYFPDRRTDREQTAWYAGFTLGRIQMPGDWVLDANYQYVGAQSAPEFDTLGGAGRGNLRNVWQFMDPSQGFTNYQGVRAQYAYCISADIMLNLKGAVTKAANPHMSSTTLSGGRGARNHFEYMEVELVYSF